MLEHKGLCAAVEYSTEDNCFFGQLIGIDGLVMFEGTTVEELKACFINAVEDYISTCEENGITPQKSYTGRLSVNIQPSLHMQIAAYARKNNTTIKDVVEQSIEYRLQTHTSTPFSK